MNPPPNIVGNVEHQDDGSVRFTKGWSKSWAAVGRAFGSTCRHRRIKSRAQLERDWGMGGRSPLPILNNAGNCCTERTFHQDQ